MKKAILAHVVTAFIMTAIILFVLGDHETGIWGRALIAFVWLLPHAFVGIYSAFIISEEKAKP